MTASIASATQTMGFVQPFSSKLTRRRFGRILCAATFRRAEDRCARAGFRGLVAFHTIAARQDGFRAFETDLIEGRWLWMTETVQSDGWMLCLASDITKLRAHGRSVRQDLDTAIKASNTDELTGVANRRFVTARMGEMLQRSSEDPVGCVCVLDLDNFKYINDKFGHQAGDLILRDFATRIQHEVRRSDCFGRVGGEEFVLVLPNTPTEAAELIVERMLAGIRNSRPLRESARLGIPSPRVSLPPKQAIPSPMCSLVRTRLCIPQKWRGEIASIGRLEQSVSLSHPHCVIDMSGHPYTASLHVQCSIRDLSGRKSKLAEP